VVGLGLCVMDEVFLVRDLSLPDRLRYETHLRCVGGMTSNALVQAAALGCQTQLLSLVGDDPDGRQCLRELRALGVGTRSVLRSPKHPTTHAVCIVEKETGERRFIVADRVRLERRVPAFDLRALAAADVLLIDGHFPTQLARALPRARRKGVPVVADFSDARPAFRPLLAEVDYPVLPLDFVRTLGHESPEVTLRWLARSFGSEPVVTLGADGAVYLDPESGHLRHVPARSVKVKDTTGAGDAFHGAFAAAIARGAPLGRAVRDGVTAGSRACRALGGHGHLGGAGGRPG